jgi:ATP-dependent helicase/nuclease subunit B
MAIRFIIGRAGTGKTHYCVEALARAMADDPLGPPLIWLVPEQATFNAERMLVTHPLVRGTMGVTVAGFRRLSHLVALDLGLGQGNHLDDIGRVLLLQEVVQKNHWQLTMFNKVADRPGFITNLDRMLRELQQHGHTPQSLREVANTLATNRADPVLANKLFDLAILLEAWHSALANRHLDPELLQQTVADRLGESPLVRGTRVWVDAFSALNLLEIRALVALAQTAASVDITLLADPASPTSADLLTPLDPLSPFLRTDRLYRRLTKTFTDANIPILPPLLLTQSPPHRFARTPALARIERDLFLPEPPLRTDPDQTSPAGLHLLECANPETEVQAAAQHIRRLIVQDTTLRYRDIGLIIPDLEGYQDAVRRVFTHHCIPHFIDLRRPITHHPLVELLRSAVTLPLGGFSTDDLVLLTKTGLTNILEGDANILENYLLGHGIMQHNLAEPFIFAEQNQSDDDDETPLTQPQKDYLAHVNQIRQTLHTAFAPWFEVATRARKPIATPNCPTGSDLTRALFDLLQRFNVESKLVALMQQARDSNNEELHLIHQQAWRQIINLLETLDRTVHDRRTTLADFSRLLSVALESLTLGLIPPTVDQVLVSSVARSRHPEMRIAFILGAVESRFPLIRSEDPLLNDYQRDLFNKSAINPIGHSTAVELLESKLLDYVAFTRAHEQLVVSYPIADQKGRAVVRSQYIARLRALFPGLVPHIITAVEEQSVDRLSTRDDLLAAVLRWGRSHITRASAVIASRIPTPAQDESRMRAAYNWLIASADVATQTALGRSWPSLQKNQPPQLAAALAAQLHGNNLRMSVSQLECFGSCPLQYFMHYTLGLRPRTELLLDSLNLGILYHRILERVFDRIIAGELTWPDCDEAALRALLDHEAQAAAEELHAELAQNSPEYAKTLQRARRNLGTTLIAQRRAAAQGQLRPAATEVTFGRHNDSVAITGARKISLPVLSVITPGHRTVGLNGKIDRVDISPHGAGSAAHVAVIDYKSSSTHVLRPYEIYYGLSLQLPVYMLVLRHQGRAIADAPLDPIAAFYVGLTQRRQSRSDLITLIAPDSDEFYQQSPPRGLIDASQISNLDITVDDENNKSNWYKYKRTKEGALDKRSNDAVEHDDFATILNFTGHKIAAMVDSLATGTIAPNPYRARNDIPCTHCDFISVCPFDRINGDFRILNPMKPAEAIDAMRSELMEPK